MPAVFYSRVISNEPGQLWELFRNFGQLAKWHPAIIDCEIEESLSPFQIGCIRRFHLADGSLFRERLLAMDDTSMTLTYSIEESPLDLIDYQACMRVIPITETGESFVMWSSTFSCPAESETELIDLVRNGVYRAGFEAVQNRSS